MLRSGAGADWTDAWPIHMSPAMPHRALPASRRPCGAGCIQGGGWILEAGNSTVVSVLGDRPLEK